MANLSILINEEGINYVWSFTKAKKILNDYQKRTGKTKTLIFQEISQLYPLTEGAVKNWFTNKNGPGDYDQVKTVARYFEVDEKSLIERTMEEEEIMEEILSKMLESGWQDNDGFNYSTIKFLAMLEELADMSKNGFIKFSEYKNDCGNKVVFIDEEGRNFGRIVLDMCVDENHHDAISFYDGGYIRGFHFTARVEEDEYDEGYYIFISGEQDMSIVIENGRWYCI